MELSTTERLNDIVSQLKDIADSNGIDLEMYCETLVDELNCLTETDTDVKNLIIACNQILQENKTRRVH